MPSYNVDLTAANFADQLANLGLTGSAHYSPAGTEFPEKMGAYEAPHVDLGWISDAGLTETMNQESNSWIPWQSTGPVRSQVTSETFQFKLVLWSMGGLANALYYGVPEALMKFDETEGIVEFTQGGKLPEDYRFGMAFDVLDGDKHRRIEVPNCSVVERGDVVHTKGEITGYELTFQANIDAELGYAVKRLFKEGWEPGKSGTTLSADPAARSLGEWHAPVNGAADPSASTE